MVKCDNAKGCIHESECAHATLHEADGECAAQHWLGRQRDWWCYEGKCVETPPAFLTNSMEDNFRFLQNQKEDL